jgi:periplasmic copper chaperone A
MRWVRWVQVTAGCALAVMAIAGCSMASASSSSGAPSIAVASAYVSVPSHGTSVGYLDIRNNGGPTDLLSVSVSVGGKVAFRAPVHTGTQPLAMHTVGEIPIPANTMTQLVPNNFHLLITDAGPMTAGKDITLTLTFAGTSKVTILALVTNPETGGSSYFLN